MTNLEIIKTTAPKCKPDENTLGFGQFFTDHMLTADYDRENGWHHAKIVPFGMLSIHPAATVLHYGSEVFEGLKAYRTSNNEIQLFRPFENAKRLNNSAERLGLPQIEESLFVDWMTTLVKTDADWVPHKEGTSLYIRPFLFGNDETLGVHSIHRAKLVIILSPVGSYYTTGISPVKICIETEDVRAVRGGTGYAKCGGNYAASVRAGEKAEKIGYSQVLWLDGVERKYIEEVGSMNVMFKIKDEIVTPKLIGSVLPGITRKSCITLMKEWGYTVSERLLSVEELFTAADDGTLTEAWGTGTAAVISPIGWLQIHGKEYEIHHHTIGDLTKRLYDTLTGVQFGKIPDTHGWIYKI